MPPWSSSHRDALGASPSVPPLQQPPVNRVATKCGTACSTHHVGADNLESGSGKEDIINLRRTMRAR